ncbi:MAG TPA: prepilin-type N-terminal cleavage/methylation domain-containing protein [Oculatellaceae cyanobacterium]
MDQLVRQSKAPITPAASPVLIDRKQIGKPAFTLAELLIALSILALIATFTIPKILVA